VITESQQDVTIIAGPIEEEAEASPLARRPRRRERLEFALPTINVIFLLMLYFLVAGTMVQKNELGMAPPETSRVPTDRLPRPLLSISESGSMLLDGVPVTLTELPAAAEKATGPEAPAHQLNVLAPADMEAGPFLAVISSLATANVAVRVVTVEKEQQAGP
jgi:biopolymer transport protein ExbD